MLIWKTPFFAMAISWRNFARKRETPVKAFCRRNAKRKIKAI
jgi:hypothetical protein